MPKVALNIGCGNKLVKSQEDRFVINIDAVPPKDEGSVTTLDFALDYDTADVSKPLFLLDDATLLCRVPEDFADEIHAYHIIEHFHPYQIQKILKKWKSVLKPEGLLALEQPDIIKCAMNLLQMLTTQNDTISYNLGLLGFYGEQKEEAPLMSHKYGWTFRTLGPVLFGAGFTDIIEQPAQTHAKERRDFRIECRKPKNG